MCALLVVFLSAVVLHSVSAGGVYCAKTARARAAALGLDYPGVHGAPDFNAPPHYVMDPGTLPSRPQTYENNAPKADEIESDMASYGEVQPRVRYLNDGAHKQAHPTNSHFTFLQSRGTYNPVQSGYTAHTVRSFPRGQSVRNRKYNFEEVKHVAPPTRVETPGQADLVNWNPGGHSKPLSFVYNKHDLDVDEFVPNRRGMSLSGLPLPRSRGHGPYQRGLAGFVLGKELPVLGSSHFPNKGHVRAMRSRNPAFARPERIRLPDHLGRSPHRNLNVKHLAEGSPVFEHLIKN